MGKHYVLALGFCGASLLVATNAAASTIRYERQSEELATGARWDTAAVEVSHDFKIAESPRALRAMIRTEKETRAYGQTLRSNVQLSRKLTRTSAIEAGFGVGTGAAYGWRSAQHLTWYRGWAGFETSITAMRATYADNTSYRYSAGIRREVARHLTFTGGLSKAHSKTGSSGSSANLGVETQFKSCQANTAVHVGREPLAPEQAGSPVVFSRSVHARVRCPVSRRASLEVGINDTQADALTRKGLSGAVVFTY